MSTTRRILIVDEDPSTGKSFEQALTGKGYSVVSVSSGEDALWELDHGAYHAVFTETVLRGMNGLEVAEEIQARLPRLPVVIVTGHGSDSVRQRATAASVAGFLLKPLNPEQIADVAGGVLQASEAATASSSPAAEAAPAQETARPVSRLKSVVLFLLAPFLGLFYILAFPVAGLGMLASLVLSADKKQPEEAEPLHPAGPAMPRVLKTIAMTLIAMVIGVAYAVVVPILGIGVLFYFSFEAWGKLGAKAIRA